MNAESVRKALRTVAKAEGGQRALARKIGVSASYINDILLRRRDPAGKVLTFLNLERVVDYRPMKS